MSYNLSYEKSPAAAFLQKVKCLDAGLITVANPVSFNAWEAWGGSMYVLRFESKPDRWHIYLEERDIPIGHIFPSADGWFGEMRLDGYRIGMLGKTPQTIADEFEAWVADDMPSGSPLLTWDLDKLVASIEL